MHVATFPYRNPATEGLCSKCWRDAENQRQRLAAKQASQPATPPALEASSLAEPVSVTRAEAMDTSSTAPAAPVLPSSPAPMKVVTPVLPLPAAAAPPAEAPAPPSQALADVPARPVQANRSRCFGCNKRVGLLGFECRCGYVFCAGHRHAADHACSFDYASMDKARLASQNPVVAASKLENRL